MLQPPNLYILITLGLFFAYSITYLLSRHYLKRSSIFWSLPFLLNFIYLIYLTTFYQEKIFDQLGIDNRLVTICVFTMTLGAILHHLAIFLKKKRNQSRLLNLLHSQISHTLFFIPFGINSITITTSLLQNFSGIANITLTITYTVITLSLSTAGLLVGFKKIKLPY